MIPLRVLRNSKSCSSGAGPWPLESFDSAALVGQEQHGPWEAEYGHVHDGCKIQSGATFSMLAQTIVSLCGVWPSVVS